ncbi:zinc ribbon domain-containing protein [Levilactobacillus tongjiangensis]|uniref:Zinc-ribbon domain-containing protein n=1 Tax=Levilactobacillus tongjiangensis TaxID=2486023 RepID=A0ABW1SSE5_9LACO|nr:zinc ribbon domain-containing protein [Levilactobacillus tongjiangensis]
MSNETNFCPNCGTALPAGSSFCPNCGYQLAQPVASEPAPVAPEPTPAADTTTTPQRQALATGTLASRNYFSWWWESFKHPLSPVENANHWFGVLTVFLEVLLNTIILSMFMQHAVTVALRVIGSDGNAINGGSLMTAVRMDFFICVFALYALVVGAAYGLRRLINAHQPLNFFEFTNHFFGATSSILAINLVAFLVAAILVINAATITDLGSLALHYAILATSIFVPSIAVLVLGYYLTIIRDVTQPRLDPLYTWILASCLLLVIIIIVGLLVGLFTEAPLSSLGDAIDTYSGY